MKASSLSDSTDIAGQQPRKTYCYSIQMVFMSLYIVYIDSCVTLNSDETVGSCNRYKYICNS
jgi:hypothetical protein